MVHEWSAVVEWCRLVYSERHAIAEFPFFGLAELSLQDARGRINSIRVLLELRKQESKKRRALGVPSGRRYSERIEAYLGWAIAGASLLKQHTRAAQAQFEQRRAGKGDDAGHVTSE